MSGLETVKKIVNAEKEAASLLENAEAKALEIRKQVDILKEREAALSIAKEKAASTVQKAEEEGNREAVQYEHQSEARINELIQRATANKEIAVKALRDMLLG